MTTLEPSLKASSPDSLIRLRAFSTVRQFSDKYPAFPRGSLRYLISLAPGNGLGMALVRIGRRKLLIDEAKFFEWVQQQQERCEGSSVRTEMKRRAPDESGVEVA